MKILLKIISIIGIIVTLGFTFILGRIPLSEGKHLLKPYIDTEFAKDYTPDKFDKIELGMTKKQVIKIIGRPLIIEPCFNDSLIMNHVYSSDGKLLKQRKADVRDYDDFAWYRSTIRFDTNEKVVYIDKGWSYD